MKLRSCPLSVIVTSARVGLLLLLLVQGCKQSAPLGDAGTRPDGSGSACKTSANNWQPQILGDAAATGERDELATFLGIWGAAADAIFVVGTKGTVVAFDGVQWQNQPTPTSETLTAVWGTSKTDVWAVGFHGVVLHYDGQRWRDRSPPYGIASQSDAGPPAGDAGVGARRNLWGVWAAGEGTTQALYAVGEQGLAIHRDDQGRWSGAIPIRADNKEIKIQDQLNAVWGLDAGRVFVAGNFGTLLVGTHAGMDKQQTGTTKDLYGVWGRAENDVYVVGRGGTILHYGTRWRSIEGAPKQVLRSIWGPETDASVVYIVGWDGAILRMTGTPPFAQGASFELFDGIVPGRRLEGIWGTMTDGGLADGGLGGLLDGGATDGGTAGPSDQGPADGGGGDAPVFDAAAADAYQNIPGLRCWVVGASGMVISGP